LVVAQAFLALNMRTNPALPTAAVRLAYLLTQGDLRCHALLLCSANIFIHTNNVKQQKQKQKKQ